ncbi:MAG: BON domain-containing protein [Acidobacteriota bacterium]|nr:BON domain-containing protein [Acidobacteriota bacterium]
MKATAVAFAGVLLLLFTMSCSRNEVSNGDAVKRAMEQADLKDVTVDENRDKRTITLGGKVHSEDAKQRAGQVAQAAAGNETIANEISVEPVGSESASRKVESNLDDGIESNYKAAIIASGLDKQDISYKAKNGVLTLTGSCKTSGQRQEAAQLASKVPHVTQVVNTIQVKR